MGGILGYSYFRERFKQKIFNPKYILVKYRSIGSDWTKEVDEEFVETTKHSRFLNDLSIQIYNLIRNLGFDLNKIKKNQSTYWESLRKITKFFSIVGHSEEELSNGFNFTDEMISNFSEKIIKAKVEIKNAYLKFKELCVLKDKMRNHIYRRIGINLAISKLSQDVQESKRKELDIKKSVIEKKILFYKESYTKAYNESVELLKNVVFLINFV